MSKSEKRTWRDIITEDRENKRKEKFEMKVAEFGNATTELITFFELIDKNPFKDGNDTYATEVLIQSLNIITEKQKPNSESIVEMISKLNILSKCFPTNDNAKEFILLNKLINFFDFR